jgi:hypothetical protein
MKNFPLRLLTDFQMHRLDILFVAPSQEPFNRPSAFPGNSEENGRTNFNSSVFYGRQITLAYSNLGCEFLLRQIKTTQLPNSSAYPRPINRNSIFVSAS